MFKTQIVHSTLTGDAAVREVKRLHSALEGCDLLARVVKDAEDEPVIVNGAFEIEYEPVHEGSLMGCMAKLGFEEVRISSAAA